MYGYIYKTTNLINGKIYIGQHRENYFNENYKGSGKILWNAINKYGWGNFKVELLEWCDNKEQLDEKEIFYIKEYNSTDQSVGYNISRGGGTTGSLELMQEAARAPEVRAKAAPKIMDTRRKKYNGDAAPWFHTDEANRKKVMTRRERYGDAGLALHTDTAKINAKLARIEKFGSSNACMMTPEVREEVRHKISDILEFDNKIFVGYSELLEYINSTYNEDISMSGLQRIAHGIDVIKYRKYLGKIKIITQGSSSKSRSNKTFKKVDTSNDDNILTNKD